MSSKRLHHWMMAALLLNVSGTYAQVAEQPDRGWSTALSGHYELQDKAHDNNGDGFADMPKTRQGSLMSRWTYVGGSYIFQSAMKGQKEHRQDRRAIT